MSLSRYLPWVAVGAVVFVAYLGLIHAIEERGADKARIKAREATIAALARQHRTDTLRLVTTRRVTDSILQVDTLLRVDTVRQLVQRERLACDALVGTCEAEKAALRELVALERKKGRGLRLFSIPVGCTAGGVVSAKGFQPGIGCGIRF